MEQLQNSNRFNTAALGGIFLSIISSLTWEDLLKTIILGAVGTAVSFFASIVLRKLFTNYKKRKSG
jgi:hypothetical protein